MDLLSTPRSVAKFNLGGLFNSSKPLLNGPSKEEAEQVKRDIQAVQETEKKQQRTLVFMMNPLKLIQRVSFLKIKISHLRLLNLCVLLIRLGV